MPTGKKHVVGQLIGEGGPSARFSWAESSAAEEVPAAALIATPITPIGTTLI